MSTPTPTWYDLLGVEPTATPEEVRVAWRSAIADLDPTERRFATLSEAAAVLLDPARRSAYDAELAAREPEPAPEPERSPQAAAEPTEPTEQPTEQPTEPVAVAMPEAGARRPAYLVPGWVLATVGVLALALVILAGVLASHPAADKVVQSEAQLTSGSKVTDIEEPAMAAQAAARTAVVPVLSYDYRTLAAGQRSADSHLTDAYRKKYDAIFDKTIKAPAASTQTVVTAKVVDAGVVRVDADRVQVLVFVDRTRVNKTSTTPTPFQDQVTVTMEHVGGRWLVDDMVTNQIPS